MNTITDYIEDDSEDDAATDAPNKEPIGEDDDHSLPKPESDTNFARRIHRFWLDVHHLVPRTDNGLFIPGMPTEHEVGEGFVIGGKRSRSVDNEDDGYAWTRQIPPLLQETAIRPRWQ